MIEITPQFLAEQGFSPTIVERFWAKVHKTESCWLWTGALSVSNASYLKCKYGMMFVFWKPDPGRTKTLRAHVVSWIIHNGPIPEGMHVLHNCPGGDNCLCVNPDHLWLGTHLENMADMKRKGRANGGTKGEANYFSKITNAQAIEIRRLWKLGINRTSIANRFGICPTHARRVAIGRAWKWLNPLSTVSQPRCKPSQPE